jgi:hypothetical protein
MFNRENLQGGGGGSAEDTMLVSGAMSIVSIAMV